MRKFLLFCLAIFAFGASLSALKANVSPQPPIYIIETGHWYVSDDGSGTGGPWSPQPVTLTASNSGPDTSIMLDIFGANGALVSSQFLSSSPVIYNIPAGGTVRVWDPLDEDSDGASGSYVIEST